MNKWNFFSLFTILLGSVTIYMSGCSEISKTQSQTNSSSNKLVNKFVGYDLNDISSHLFGIEGEVISINKTSTVIKSITVKVIGPLPTALGYVPYDRPGEVVLIRFDESIPRLENIRLFSGSIIRLQFGEINNSANRPNNWGSNFSWIAVEKNGVFFNTKGTEENF